MVLDASRLAPAPCGLGWALSRGSRRPRPPACPFAACCTTPSLIACRSRCPFLTQGSTWCRSCARVGLAGVVGFFVGPSHPHPPRTQPLRATCELDEPSSVQPP